MSKNFLLPLVSISLFICSTVSAQDLSIEEIVEKVGKTNELLVKSEFNNFQFTIKENGQELISPDYSETYLLFKDGYIGIHNIQNQFFYKPVLLSEAKKVNASPNPVLYYTREGDMLSFDKHQKQIVWTSDKEKIKFRWIFENFKVASPEELQRYKVVYGIEENNDLSENSHNLIGVHRTQAINRYSGYYKEPVIVDNKSIDDAQEKDLVLYFESKEDPELNSVLIFDEYDQCKYLIHYYPSAYYESIMNIYEQTYGEHSNKWKWNEKIGSKDYVYEIRFFEDKFGLEVKKAKPQG